MGVRLVLGTQIQVFVCRTLSFQIVIESVRIRDNHLTFYESVISWPSYPNQDPSLGRQQL